MNGGGFNSLEEAVLSFYDSNNPLQQEAQKWLSELQNSPRVWSAIWDELLSSKRTELQFYGATMLHSKLLKDWGEIPLLDYEALKSKLLEAIVYFKDGPNVVLNRLCISLAVFILRTTAPYWPNAVSDVISLFQNASLFQNVPNVSAESLSWLLLEILSVIPEEFQTISLSKNERVFVRNSLESDNLTVLAFIEVALTSTNVDIKLQALKCAKSWLEFGLPLENCENLLNLLINIVVLAYMSGEASQCSVSAVEAISIICIDPSMVKYPKLIISFFIKTLLLVDILNSSPKIPNEDLIPCLYTLFVSVGEEHVKVFVKMLNSEDRNSFLKLLCVILQCSDAPGHYPVDEVYSLQTFNFWYQLQDEILGVDFPNQTEIHSLIKPYFRKLILILMRKSMYPKDMADWSHDDKDKFRCYRQDIADTYTYCYALLNHELMDLIAERLEQAIIDPNVITEWPKVESYLYAFYAISENAICSENPKVLHCILLLEKLPLSSMNVRVSYTIMELVGSYAEWLCSFPELLEPVLSLTFTGIENSQLAGPATLALKDIVRECKTVLLPFAQTIADKTMILLEKQHLNSTEESGLIFSFSTAVSLLPEKTLKYLDLVVTPYITKVKNILVSPPQNKAETERAISSYVTIFTQLFLGLSVKPPEPEFRLLQELLPIFKVILEQYTGQNVVASTCVAIKCAISNLGDACCDLVPMIVEIVVSTYFNNPENALLDLAKQLLLLFGNNVNCTELMSRMLKTICELTLVTFKSTTPETVSDHTSLFEHFYSFCTNVLKKNCKLLLDTDGIEHAALFRYAGFALCAAEVQTVKSASSFLCNVITISREQDVLLGVVQLYGGELVQLTLVAIGKISPRNCIDYVADVLVALSKKYCDWLSRWLNDLLAAEGFPTTRATPVSKKRFIKSVLREKANKRRVHETTKEFSFLCRGLLNKEYVEHTTSDL